MNFSYTANPDGIPGNDDFGRVIFFPFFFSESLNKLLHHRCIVIMVCVGCIGTLSAGGERNLYAWEPKLFKRDDCTSFWAVADRRP